MFRQTSKQTSLWNLANENPFQLDAIVFEVNQEKPSLIGKYKVLFSPIMKASETDALKNECREMNA